MTEETAISNPDDPRDANDEQAIEGEIVNGTWVNPRASGYTPPPSAGSAEFNYRTPDGRPSFMRMIFGSFVILTEEITERAAIDDDDAPREIVEAAIHQAANQQEALDRRPYADLRYGTIGLLGTMLDRAQDGTGRLSGVTNTAAQAAGRIIDPLWNSFLFRPLHRPVMRAEQAGQEKVNEWVRRGRVEEVQSRALAEVSINNFVEESVTDITTNPQVQMLVQEVITSQSTSLVGEILGEVRERFVSLDILFMGKLRQEEIAAPPFRDAYVEQLAHRRQSYGRLDLQRSMAGNFAGPVSRLFAFLIDVVILLIIVGIISSFVSNTLSLFGLTDTINEFLRSEKWISTVALLLITSFNLLIISIYFIISFNLNGSTVGDSLLGLRAVNREGGRVSLMRSILRLIGMYVSASVLFIGFFWALFDDQRQGWHDKFGGTFMLYDWPAKPDEEFLNEQVAAELAD